jgi:hypothetical protein
MFEQRVGLRAQEDVREMAPASTQDSLATLKGLLAQHEKQLLAIPGVVGVGIGYRDLKAPGGAPAIQVFVRSATVSRRVVEKASAVIGRNDIKVIASPNIAPL